MRVVAGLYKGLKLMGPTHQGLRPTTDMVREALFNILQNSYYGGKVLDLFAGSGALGIEALSRGAQAVTFVEQDSRSLRLLKQNLERIRDESVSFRVIPSDVFRTLPRLDRENEKYDLILVDPPYYSNLWEHVLNGVEKFHLLKEKGLVVLEMPKTSVLPENMGDLTRRQRRIYGEIALEFWGHIGDEANDDCHLSREL